MKRMIVTLALIFGITPAQGPAPSTNSVIDQVEALLNTLRTPTAPAIVPSGTDINALITAGPTGATYQLAVGGTYGPILLNKDGVSIKGAPVTIGRTDPKTTRYAVVTGLDHLLTIPVGVKGVSVSGIEWAGVGGGMDLITSYGSGVTFDSNYIHGDAVLGQKRGIALNGDHVDIVRNYISDVKREGQDAQAVGSCDGDGPFNIIDNYLEASGENIMFGGCDPTVVGRIATKILIRANTITKPLAWKGLKWSIKNLLELKNARDVEITENVMSNSWKAGQDGYAIALTVRNQDGHCPWCTIERVLINQNDISHTNGGVNILGRDDEVGKPSGVMQDVTLRSNTFTDINTAAFGTVDAPARGIFVQGGPVNLVLEGNTLASAGAKLMNSFLVFGQPQYKLLGLIVRGNTFDQGKYGLLGDGAPGIGAAALTFYAPDAVWDANTVHKGASTQTVKYPAGTILVP